MNLLVLEVVLVLVAATRASEKGVGKAAVKTASVAEAVVLERSC